MRIRQLHQDLARLTREVGPYGGLDSDGGAIDAVLWIVYRLRATLGEFENAHRQKMTHPFIVGDVVRCLIGTALEHETLVTGIATNDAGEHFVSLESNRGFGCTIPASHVLLVRRVGESGPIEDVRGPVAMGYGLDLQFKEKHPPVEGSVTRAEFDELVARLVDHSKRISAVAGRVHVIEEAETPSGKAFDDLACRLDQHAIRLDHADAATDRRLDQLAENVAKLEGEWRPIITAVGHALGAEIARQQMKENGA